MAKDSAPKPEDAPAPENDDDTVTLDNEGGETKVNAASGVEVRKRKGGNFWTNDDIRNMSGHLFATHKVDPTELFGIPFTSLMAKHDGFHGKDDHWMSGK